MNSAANGKAPVNTPTTKKKGPGSIGGADDPNDDTKSNASSSSSNKAQIRRTPAQVKAADAKKAKPIKSTKDASLNPPANTPIKKQSVISNNKPNCNATKDTVAQKEERVSDSEEKKSVENLEISKDETKVPKREKTPDIISGAVIQKPKDNMEPQVMMNEEDEPSNDKSEGEEIKVIPEVAEKKVLELKSSDEIQDEESKEEMKEDEQISQEQTPAKHIISSEEEAKARLAEKRRLMKEKMEREAELERQRLAEIERIEEERRLKEEEEERKAMEEAEKIAAEARRIEEERLQKAIEEAQKREAEERAKRDEEERIKKEAEQKAKEEAERKQAELEEKLKKEEEERLARKKRIEEIMARTRGKGGATPKKEETEKETAPSTSQPEPEQPRQPPSLDTNVDPTTPDLLGDIGDKVEENNVRNLARSNGEAETETVEKGAAL